MRGICRSSGARVLCEREADAGPGPIRVVQLSGTRAEVAAAKVSGTPRPRGVSRRPQPTARLFHPTRNSSWRR